MGSFRRQLYQGVSEAQLLVGMFIACIAYSIAMASIGWSHTLLDRHGFRQTQTAISTYFMLRGGPWLTYETPVLGAPWAIPLEFPLYQWTVALLVRTFATPLDQTGRFVSEVFFYGTLVPTYLLLGRLGVRPHRRLIFLSLLLVSPQYVFWSRCFLIESTALFCGMWYLALTVGFRGRKRRLEVGAAILFGALAATVKLTTFLPFVLAALLFVVHIWWQTGMARFSQKGLVRLVLSVLLLVAVPALCGMFWARYADSVRVQNPLAGFITSGSVSAVYFGTLAQRVSRGLWITLLWRTVPDVVGHSVVVLLGAALLVVSRRPLHLFLLCAVLFLVAPLTFTNVYVIHDYYAFANGVFLIAAIGWCVVGLLECEGTLRWVGMVLLISTIGVSMWRHVVSFVPVQRGNVERNLDIAQVLQRVTRPDDVILILGLDWNPELPYYARRRALMNREGKPPEDAAMRRAMASLRDYHLGAMVVCFGARGQRQLVEQWVQVAGVLPAPQRATGCDIYTRTM